MLSHGSALLVPLRSGIVRNEDANTCDVSAWKMLRGSADHAETSAPSAAAADSRPVATTRTAAITTTSSSSHSFPPPQQQPKVFHRLQGKVTAYKAGEESSALFETDLLMEKGGAVLHSVSGYVWVWRKILLNLHSLFVYSLPVVMFCSLPLLVE